MNAQEIDGFEYQPQMLPRVIASMNSRRGDWPKISDGSGVPYHTIQKIVQQQTSNPGVASVERLDQYLTAEAAEPDSCETDST